MVEFHRALYESLKDSSLPENRIFRKVFVLTLCAIIYFIALELNSSESIVGIAVQSLLIFYILGLIGGISVAAFYRKFLESVGATEEKLSFPVFIVEWLLAFCAPIPPILLALSLSAAANNV